MDDFRDSWIICDLDDFPAGVCNRGAEAQLLDRVRGNTTPLVPNHFVLVGHRHDSGDVSHPRLWMEIVSSYGHFS